MAELKVDRLRCFYRTDRQTKKLQMGFKGMEPHFGFPFSSVMCYMVALEGGTAQSDMCVLYTVF